MRMPSVPRAPRPLPSSSSRPGHSPSSRHSGSRGTLALALLLAAAVSGAAVACPLARNDLLKIDGYLPPLVDGLALLVDQLIRAESGAAAIEARIEVDRPASEVGRWLPPEPWPVIGIHAAVLPTGKVLHFSYPFLPSQGSRARLWDPRRGSFQSVDWSVDLFCGGTSFLPDGRLLVSGGNDPGACQFRGLTAMHVFDPVTQRWSEAGQMRRARWYPTNVTLGDGRTLLLSGLDRNCEINPLMEIYGADGTIELVPEGERRIELYPRVHLLPDGRVAHVGPEPLSETFDLEQRSWRIVGRTRYGRERFEGTSFLVPGRPDEIMICGGFPTYESRPTATCERIDFSRRSPSWRSAAPYHLARAHANVVTLPDGTVLAVGGGTDGLYAGPVLNAELYDPEDDSWTMLPPQSHGRMYHSTAVLLPDGRVLSAGQDDDGGDDGIVSGRFAEIYEPAYLFRGKRPRIRKAPRSVAYAGELVLKVPKAAKIDSVSLIRLAAQTHSVNTPQRYVALDFEVTARKKLRVTAPEHGNLAPPGYYMLFVVDADGVPSKARFVQLL